MNIKELASKLNESVSASEVDDAKRLLSPLLKELKARSKGKENKRTRDIYKEIDKITRDEELSDKEVKKILQVSDMYGVK